MYSDLNMTAVRDKTSMKMQNTNKDTQKTSEWQQPQGDKETQNDFKM